MKNIKQSITITNIVLFSKMNNYICYTLVSYITLLGFAPMFTYSDENLYLNNLVIDSIDFYQDFRKLLK
jgi:hypothetical protein